MGRSARRGTRVYRVQYDPRYRQLVTTAPLPLAFDGSAFDGVPPLVRADATETTAPLGHFVQMHPGALVAAPSVPDEVTWGFFEMAGQTLV